MLLTSRTGTRGDVRRDISITTVTTPRDARGEVILGTHRVCFLFRRLVLYLTLPSGDDERSTSSQSPRRQAQAILTFASNALQQMSSAHGGGTESNSALLTLLLNIAVTKEDELARASMEKVSSIARGAIIYALKVMRAQDFIVGVVKVLDMGQLAVRISTPIILTCG